MVPPTRRALLQGAAGLTAVLSGCSGLIDGTAEPTPTATRGVEPVTDGPASGSETDPETLRLRVDGDRQPIWLADPEDTDGGPPTHREGERHLDSAVIGDPSGADRLAVADDVRRDRVDAFLADTDLDRETLYVETIRVEECFLLDLCRIAWQPTEVSTDYARTGRPYDERCAVDEWAVEARLVRIPDALDPERVTGHSTSVGTGSCAPARRRSGAGDEGGSGPAPAGDRRSPAATGTATTGTGGDR